MIRNILSVFFIVFLAVACKNKQTISGADVKKSDDIQSEIIVELKPGVSVRRLTTVFKEYELRTINSINQSMNLWLVTYNTDKIEPEEMLKKVKASSAVVSAEFNKKVTLR